MELGHLLQLLTSSDSLLTAGVGALIALFFFLRWLVTRHVVKLEEDITELKRTNEELAHQVKLAESSRIQAVEERDHTKQDLAHAREEVKKALETANQYEQAWEKLNMLRQKNEETIKQLTEELIAAKERETELHDNRSKLEDKWRKAQRMATRYRKRARELETQINVIIKQDGRVWRRKPVNVPRFVPLTERKGPVIISVLNLKGGVGKTTITANLGGYLSRVDGKRVLMIDVDHQRSLSQMLLSVTDRKAAAADGHTVQHFLKSSSRNGHQLLSCVETVPNLDNCSILINTDARPGHGDDQSLDDLEMHLMSEWLVNPAAGDVRFLMRWALHADVVRERFDYILFDCPPRLSTGCLNALTASDYLLIPVQAETISIRSVQHLLTRLRELRQDEVLAHLRVLGMVANMISAKADDHQSQEGKLLENAATAARNPQIWGQPITLFQTKLIRTHYYAEATQELDNNRRLKLAIDYPSIRKQYHNLIKEIEERVYEDLSVAGVSR